MLKLGSGLNNNGIPPIMVHRIGTPVRDHVKVDKALGVDLAVGRKLNKVLQNRLLPLLMVDLRLFHRLRDQHL